jgi:hypothetical protein
MRCSAIVALLALTAVARADTRVATAVLLVEPGQAGPVLHLRNIGTNGAMWDVGIDGWTASAAIERPLERDRKFFASVELTPTHAHSSNRIYVDGRRARDREFDDASYTIRGGLRLRQNDRSSTELAALLGREVNDLDAWSSPYAGVLVLQRYRRATAYDPFDGRIHGFELSALGEIYGGDRTWSRLTLTENAGRPLGRLHLRQSAAVFAGSNLDRVSSFLVGGSWDVLGPLAIYGRHYAEFRVTRGIVANAGADYALTPRWDIGARVSAFRGMSIDATGAALQTTLRAGGLRFTLGAAGSGDRTMLFAQISGAAFLRQ